MRTICSKLIWSCNHIQLHVGTRVHPYKGVRTPPLHSHEAVGQTHHQDWTGQRVLLQVGFGIFFVLQHIRHISDRIMYFKDHFGILEPKPKITFN